MDGPRHTTLRTRLGDLTVSADGEALTGLYFPGHWHPPSAERLGAVIEADADPLLVRAREQLEEYLAGQRQEFDLPRRVWALLQEIPYGETTTYGALAAQLGTRGLAQRVGQCVGRNPLSIVVPCHRVVGADGSLTGYAGGLERKRALLELEEPDERSAERLF